MTLSLRLGLLLSALVLMATLLFGLIVYQLFTGQQDQQFQRRLNTQLDRTQSLMQTPRIGGRLVSGFDEDLLLQIIAEDGELFLPAEADFILPEYQTPTLSSAFGTTKLIGSRPWLSLSGERRGSIRLAVDIQAGLDARKTLLRTLILAGVLIGLLTLALGFWTLRRALKPLSRLAQAARNIDPAQPSFATYEGPNDEVADVARALNFAVEGIRARQDAEKTSLATISHELARPITLVTGYLDALAESYPEDLRLQAGKEAAQELMTTSKALLTLARGEAQNMKDTSVREVIELAKVVRKLALEQPGVKVGRLMPATVIAAPEAIDQLIRSVLSYAVSLSRKPEDVTLNLTEGEAAQVKLEISLFSPEATIDEAGIFESPQASTGEAQVGLSVARSIAEKYGGGISVTVEDRSSHFLITLPAIELENLSKARKSSPASPRGHRHSDN